MAHVYGEPGSRSLAIRLPCPHCGLGVIVQVSFSARENGWWPQMISGCPKHGFWFKRPDDNTDLRTAIDDAVTQELLKAQ